MKIAFLLPQNVIGGGALVVYEHARHLKNCGHEVLIIFRQYIPGRDGDFFSSYGLDHIPFDDADAKALQFDVIIATWWETFYDIFVFKANNYFYLTQDDERRFYEDAASFKVKFCDLTYKFPNIGAITISGWWQKQLIAEGNHVTKVAPNGYDGNLLKADNRKQNETGKLRVLIEGPGDTWFRRIEDCFKATAGLENIEVWFKSRGNFLDPSWKFDKIFYNVSATEMKEIYSQCDVLLKMSEIEAFCLPNLEMMATGGTIITTDFTGHEEYAVNGVNSIVIGKRDIEAARTALIQLRDDRTLLLRLQQAALQTAQKMTWEKQTPGFEKALMELLDTFKNYDYTAEKRLILKLREIKLALEVTLKAEEKLRTDYDALFEQHHRTEYSVFRYLGRVVYRLPIAGSLLRTLFKSKS
jgi:glycosyltransferase involved in cell wall biosynthesis